MVDSTGCTVVNLNYWGVVGRGHDPKEIARLLVQRANEDAHDDKDLPEVARLSPPLPPAPVEPTPGGTLPTAPTTSGATPGMRSFLKSQSTRGATPGKTTTYAIMA